LILLLSTAFLALLGIAVPTGTAGAAPQASSLDVFVGYADTLRANPTQFPTPWDGAPGVVFAGCHANCSFDAGAARFVNNSPGPLTLDFVHVRLSTCVFDMWPHGTVLQSGQQFIVTQTATGAADGCDNSAGFFDTSDIGPNGTAARHQRIRAVDTDRQHAVSGIDAHARAGHADRHGRRPGDRAGRVPELVR
jgi:hypothetical protein